MQPGDGRQQNVPQQPEVAPSLNTPDSSVLPTSEQVLQFPGQVQAATSSIVSDAQKQTYTPASQPGQSIAPQDTGTPGSQPAPPPSLQPQVSLENSPHGYHMPSAAKLKTAGRSVAANVFINVLAAAVLAGLGWFGYRMVGVMGVHYGDVKIPLANARSDMRKATFQISIDAVPDTSPAYAHDSAYYKSKYDNHTKLITTYEKAYNELSKTKPFKKGSLASDFTTLKNKHEALIPYLKARAASALSVNQAIVPCQIATNIYDADASSKLSTCIKSLQSLKQDTITDTDLRAFLKAELEHRTSLQPLYDTYAQKKNAKAPYSELTAISTKAYDLDRKQSTDRAAMRDILTKSLDAASPEAIYTDLTTKLAGLLKT